MAFIEEVQHTRKSEDQSLLGRHFLRFNQEKVNILSDQCEQEWFQADEEDATEI